MLDIVVLPIPRHRYSCSDWATTSLQLRPFRARHARRPLAHFPQHSGSTKEAHEHILSALEKVVKRSGFITRRRNVTSPSVAPRTSFTTARPGALNVHKPQPCARMWRPTPSGASAILLPACVRSPPSPVCPCSCFVNPFHPLLFVEDQVCRSRH